MVLVIILWSNITLDLVSSEKDCHLVLNLESSPIGWLVHLVGILGILRVQVSEPQGSQSWIEVKEGRWSPNHCHDHHPGCWNILPWQKSQLDVLTIVNIHWINLTRCLHHPQSCHRQCCLLEENPSFPSLPNEPSPHPRFLLFPLFLLFPIHLPHHLASPLLFHCHPFLPFPRSAGKIFSALLDPAPCQSNNVDFQNEIKEKQKTLERRWSFCWQAVLSIPGPLSDTSYLQIKNVRKNSTHLKTESFFVNLIAKIQHCQQLGVISAPPEDIHLGERLTFNILCLSYNKDICNLTPENRSCFTSCTRLTCLFRLLAESSSLKSN